MSRRSQRQKVFVCDDEKRRVDEWSNELKRVRGLTENYEILPIYLPEIESILTELDRRRARARRRAASSWGKLKIDDAAIFIVDYDLVNVPNGYVTGEDFAYLARCYSTCGVIVALNRFGENSFDLTLRGHPESFADLHIGGSQLANTGLWHEGEAGWRGFRPWTWPLLPQLVESFERRRKKIRQQLDKKILDHFRFPKEVIEILPRTLREFLESWDKSGNLQPAEKVTFRDFVLRSQSGLRPKDGLEDDASVARVAAARVAKWLESVVLPGQDILVDAPHLVSRYPSVLEAQPAKLSTFNRAASLTHDLGLKNSVVAKHRFEVRDWISRPTWFWKSFSADDQIPEVKTPWSAEPHNWVFCEDMSRFLPRSEAREFVADLESPFVRRFIAQPKRQSTGAADELENVEYRPSVRLSI